MKKLFGLILLCGAMAGCNSGDVPITDVPTSNVPAAQGNPAEQPQNQTQAIQSNPNLPQVAKDAVLGKGK